MAVDFNEMKIFINGVGLLGEVCELYHEYDRAFYFYNQCRVCACVTKNYHIAIDCFVSMAKICFKIKKYLATERILKKGLAYAWRICDITS